MSDDARKVSPAGVTRRAALKVLGAVGVGTAAGCRADTPANNTAGAHGGHAAPAAAGARPTATFFTPHERATVTVLVDYMIPRDARSGSAADAGVPAWMDAFLADADTDDEFRAGMRGGLAWLDAECNRRFGTPEAAGTFQRATDAQRRQVLDDIAYPARARPAMGPGVAFFNRFRDFTASGFFSSRIGVEDLRYTGNVAVPVWDGCPAEANARLGVSQALMANRVAPRNPAA